MDRLAIAVVVFAMAGCDRTPPPIPKIDYTDTPGYGVADFKDDAPSNSKVADADLPLNFVACDGTPIDLTQYRGKKKVVLIVLRGIPRSLGGALCPSCLAQTSCLLANQQEFQSRGAEVLVVFPGPSERLGEFLQKAKRQTPGEPECGFRVLLDRELAACDRLGIRDDLAKPSTYILDTQGRLVYAYVGATSTDRPSLKAILAELDKNP
jgi:peroxiredoxin